MEHADDLRLAQAAGRGDAAAIAEIDARIAPIVESALARMRGRVSLDDVAQLLRQKLFVAQDGAAPKILEYSGRGPLGAFLRVAATRIAIGLTRRGDAAAMEPVTRDRLAKAVASSDSPEAAFAKKAHVEAFKAAFEDALAELSAEDRNILRLSVVDDLSIDEIAVVFAVHRATAARRLSAAREALEEGTRKRLVERLGVGGAELAGIADAIRSQLDLSLVRVLGEEP